MPGGENMQLPSRKALALGVPILAGVAIGLWYGMPWRADQPADVLGVVRSTEIRMASEVSGRLAQFAVERGQTVQRGQLLAVLRNPELSAALEEAKAQVEKAKSDRNRIYAGVRQEQVEALQREILKAQAAMVLARQELQRKATLAATSDSSIQNLDIARADEARAEADVAIAEAKYAEAKSGPTPEERALADAQVTVTETARDVLEARVAKLELRAPVAGVVGLLVPEIGEAVTPGEPVLTLLPDAGIWFGFNLREDALGRLSVGSQVPVHLPGAADPILATLSELRNWGEFAAWRAARATGDHDLNMLFLRLDPVRPFPASDPGRTVLLNPLSTTEQDR
jgi:HlyD family secretion protein